MAGSEGSDSTMSAADDVVWRRSRVAPAVVGAILIALACFCPAVVSLLRNGNDVCTSGPRHD